MKYRGGLRTKGIKKESYQNHPLISIVTIVRNGEKTLKRTISSVLNQTYKNVEYIVVDGGSTDGTLSILKNFNAKIDYWISEADNGISDAFNKGINLAQGEIIGIINADDWYELNACQMVADNFCSKFDVYYGACNIYKDNLFIRSMTSSYKNLTFKMSIYHPTCFITKKVYDNIGTYSVDYQLTMDYDLLIRIFKGGFHFKQLESTIANFQLGGVSNSNKLLGIKEIRKIKNLNGINNKLLNQFHYYIQIFFLKVFELKNAV